MFLSNVLEVAVAISPLRILYERPTLLSIKQQVVPVSLTLFLAELPSLPVPSRISGLP